MPEHLCRQACSSAQPQSGTENIWMFDGGEKCSKPHLDEESIKSLFLKAVNAIFEEKDGLAERFNGAKAWLSEVGQSITERQAKRRRGILFSKLEFVCVLNLLSF